MSFSSNGTSRFKNNVEGMIVGYQSKRKKEKENELAFYLHIELVAVLLGLSDVHQQANKSRTFLGITQDKPKRVNIALHRA